MDDLASIAADWIWQTDADLRIDSLRGAYEGLTGRPILSALGAPWPGLETSTESADLRAVLLRAPSPFREVVVPHLHPDGRRRWFRLGGAPLFAEDGTFRGFRGVALDVSAAREAEAESHETTRLTLAGLVGRHRKIEEAFECMSHGLHMLDRDMRLMAANRCFREIYGFARDEIWIGMPLEQLVRRSAERGNHSGLTPDEAWAAASRRMHHRTPYRVERGLPGGRVVALTVAPMPDGGYVTTHEEITDRKRAESRLEEEHRRLDTALAHMSHGLVLFDADHRIVVFNQQFLGLHGLSTDRVHVGMSAEDLMRHRVAAGNFPGMTTADVWRHTSARINSRTAYRVDQTMRDGRTIAVAYAPTPDGGFVTMHEDVTAQKQAEARIAHMARHDALTGLPNRTMLHEQLEAALEAGDGIGVLCLDLDRFKAVNDTLGHAVGDELLRQATKRLRLTLSHVCGEGEALLARLGGDEFAAVLPHARASDVQASAVALIEAVAEDFDIDDQHVSVGLSVGVALAPAHGTDPEQLLRAADMALYQAKAAGRGTFRFFEPAMDVAVRARRSLELDLREALAQEQLELHYQPFLALDENRISGFEALLRWNHPGRGHVPPSEFVPLAEETGLILPLGEWVLHEACRQAARWPGDTTISVNLSPVQFRSAGLVLAVAKALREAAMDARRLQLEITEGVLLREDPATLSILHALKAQGVRIAMDDFGTGYSSLGYLRSFPFDTIKIDRSFVADIAARPDAAAIVRAVTSLGASLGMRTTAEGVETEEQLRRLRADGCDEAQGYLISRPRPAADIPPLLQADWALRFAA